MKLPTSQYALLRAWVLGGFEAIGSRTVDSLMRRGLLDANGPTVAARKYVDETERRSFSPSATEST